MDTQQDLLADEVRARRVTIDNDLELLRVKLRKVDPRRLDVSRVARVAVPIAAGVAATWWWAHHRRSVNSLQALLLKELADLLANERAQATALERMTQQATNPDLRQAFEQHRVETLAQCDRLERVFRSVGATPKAGVGNAVEGVLAAAKQRLKRTADARVRDAWLIATAQRIEHLEIANYGTARTFAATLGYTPAAELLQQTLEEEKRADETLTRLAERFVNPQLIR
jgi:ferritin-like metal-binding protein YciE